MLTPSEAARRGEAEALAGVPAGNTAWYVQWGPVIAGALIAASLGAVLLSFGSAIGLATISSSPSWRDTSAALTALAGIYLVLTVLVSFGAGGYLVGRLRVSWDATLSGDEIEFRDGVHGVLAWAIAVVVSAGLIGASAVGVASKAVGPASSAGSASPVNATSGEAMLAYQLDRLFQTAPPRTVPEFAYHRAEAGRILLTADSRRGVEAGDRAYLVQLVASATGLAMPAAERRVDDAVIDAKVAVRKARKSAVILGFSVAASLLLGVAAAWYAAASGGRHRDDLAPPYNWRWPRPPHPQ